MEPLPLLRVAYYSGGLASLPLFTLACYMIIRPSRTGNEGLQHATDVCVQVSWSGLVCFPPHHGRAGFWADFIPIHPPLQMSCLCSRLGPYHAWVRKWSVVSGVTERLGLMSSRLGSYINLL